jgi:uncharacterized protein YndB with AHSA1/START domain
METDIEKQQEGGEMMEIRKSILIEASPEVVFRAITDPNELTKWFPDQAIFEPRVGGKMKFSFYKKNAQRQDRDYFPQGTIIEFVPNKKISYTWEHPDIPDFPKTVVTWELEKIDNSRTKLDLLHSGFKPDKMIKEHDEGWTYYLTRLEGYCQGGV